MLENLSLFCINSLLWGVAFLGITVTFLGFAYFPKNLKKIYVCSSLIAICGGTLIFVVSTQLNVFRLKTNYSTYIIRAKFDGLSVFVDSKIKIIKETVTEEGTSEYKLIALVKCETLKSYNECLNKFQKNESEIISNNKNDNSSNVVSL